MRAARETVKRADPERGVRMEMIFRKRMHIEFGITVRVQVNMHFAIMCMFVSVQPERSSQQPKSNPE